MMDTVAPVVVALNAQLLRRLDLRPAEIAVPSEPKPSANAMATTPNGT